MCCASTSSAPVRSGGVSCAFSATASMRGAAFQHLEAVGRHQHGLRRLVEPVVGAADALHQPRRALRRADIDDQIDVAPVDAEIERGRADHRAQLAGRHGVLDLAALRDIERAVMQRDGEVVVVDAPQLLEEEFGLAAGVDEDQRGLVRLDQRVDFAERVARRMAGPGQMLVGVEHGDAAAGRRLAPPPDRRAPRPPGGCGTRKRHRSSGSATVADRPTVVSCGASANSRARPSDKQIAALGGDQRMQFVEHDAPERAEQIRRVGAWRAAAPAAPAWSAECRADRGAGAGASMPACRRCGSRAGPAGPSRAPGFPGCGRCRPRAPSAARCRACAGPATAAGRGRSKPAFRPGAARCSSTSVGRKPASVLPPPVGAISSTERPARALASNSS